MGHSLIYAQVEQGVAQACGAWYNASPQQVVATSPPALGPGDINGVNVPSLQSNLALGSFEETYILRRGIQMDMSALPGFNTADRVRRVASQDSGSGGRLNVDAPWFVPPVFGEAIELTIFDPSHEWRRATLAGLRRCFRMENLRIAAPIGPGPIVIGTDWLTEAEQIYEVYGTASDPRLNPRPLLWWRASDAGNQIELEVAPSLFPNDLIVWARRTYASDVTTNSTSIGQIDELASLSVDIDYAVAAGVVEMWRYARQKMAAQAQIGLAPTLAEAASDLHRQAWIHFQPPTKRSQLSRAFGIAQRRNWAGYWPW